MSKPVYTAPTEILSTDSVTAAVANTMPDQLDTMLAAVIAYLNASTTLSAYGITDPIALTTGVDFSGDVILDNTINLKSKDSGGTSRNVAHVTSGNALTIGDATLTMALVGSGSPTLNGSALLVASQLGAASGIATLDSGGKVPTSQLPASVLGDVQYQGTWNATTNTPTLPAASTVQGHYYIVATAGTYTSIDFEIGDWVISDGTNWDKVDNTDAVTSVFGRIGAVTAATNDYTWAQINKATSSLADITTRLYSDLQSKPTTIAGFGITDHLAYYDAAETISGAWNYTVRPTISGNNIPDIASAFTWASLQTFSVRPVFNGNTPYDSGNAKTWSPWVGKTTTYTAVDRDAIMADTSGGAWTLTLPASPATGSAVLIADAAGTFATNNLTVAHNGSNIMGSAADLIMETNNASAWLVYYGGTRGWVLVQP